MANFSNEIVLAVWNKGLVVPGANPSVRRKGDKIRVKYTFGGGFLAEWMPRVNSSFGPLKFGEYYEKTGILMPAHSTLLGYRDSFRTFLCKRKH